MSDDTFKRWLILKLFNNITMLSLAIARVQGKMPDIR